MGDYAVAVNAKDGRTIYSVWRSPWIRLVADDLPRLDACFLAEKLNVELGRVGTGEKDG